MAAAAGISGVVEAAAAVPVPADPDAPVQLDLGDLTESEAHLGLPDAVEVLAIREAEGCDMVRAVELWRDRGGRGRKPGSRNRRTGDFAKLLAAHAPHPGLALARIYARPVEQLAAELGCKKLEAAHLQVRAASELLPYVEGKKPVDVNLNTNGHMTLILGSVAAPIDGGELVAAGEPMLPIGFAETQPNQGLGNAGAGQSE